MRKTSTFQKPVIQLLMLFLFSLAIFIEVSPASDDPRGYLKLGDTFFETKKYRDAAENYEYGLSLLKESTPGEHAIFGMIYNQIASCYLLMGNNNQALFNFYSAIDEGRIAMEVDREGSLPILYHAYGAILDIYDNEMLYEQMMAVTDEFIDLLETYKKDLLPDDVIDSGEVNNYLAYCYAQKGIKLDEALLLIDDALAKSPGSYAMIDTKGWVLYKMGRFTEAKKNLEIALKLCAGAGDDCYLIKRHLDEVSKKVR